MFIYVASTYNGTVILLFFLYSYRSSLYALIFQVVNKLTVRHLPVPAFVLLCQLVFSTLFISIACSCVGTQLKRLEFRKILTFSLVALGFALTIFFNMKVRYIYTMDQLNPFLQPLICLTQVLQSSNVETFITFRSTTPLIMSFLDWILLGHELPGLRNLFCLLCLCGGAAGYVIVDTNFKVGAYLWLLAW